MYSFVVLEEPLAYCKLTAVLLLVNVAAALLPCHYRDAKLCVLCWDDTAADIRVGSLHSFEGDLAAREVRLVVPPPRLAADPQGR
jgi:hypothetical protein